MPDPASYRYGDPAEYNWLMGEVLKHETPQALHLAELLYTRLNPYAVIDIGGGPGVYLLGFKQRGIKVLCVDGATNGGGSLDASEFELWDLRNPYRPALRYSLVLCIEVAEHLQPEHADTLVDTVCACAPIVFWSAAGPGQGGEGHWNEQKPEYWFEKFAKRGFYVSEQETRELHEVIDNDPAYEFCHWLRWHSHLLRQKEA